MKFLATLVAGAAYVASAVAQVNIAFTSVPVAVVAGQPTNITWGGGDGVTPVTITLRKGNPQDLQTVSTLTSTGSKGYFLWTPDSSLATASDYALQITQGQSYINYSGPFAVIGGTGSSSISYSGTSTLTASMNSTMTSMGVTSVGPGASMGTGVPVSRNTTFSSQTLASTTSASRTTSGSATTSASASGTTSATSAPTGGASQMASSLALILGVVGAIISLN